MSSTLPNALQGKSKMFWVGIATIVLSVAPIILYSAFGPKDGNPIGFGLLMTAGVPLGILFLAISGRRTVKRL